MKKVSGLLSVLAVCGILVMAGCSSSGSKGGNSPASSSSKEITSFEIISPVTAIGVIDESGKTINIIVPYATDVSKLIVKFVTTGAKTTISNVEQISCTTSLNFSNPAAYTVTAQDGSASIYVVTVTIAKNSAKDITKFEIANQSSSVINGNGITVTMPFGTSVTSLSPTITHTGADISPASNEAQNFSNSVTYTVTAADGLIKAYTVTVAVSKNSAKDISKFTILGIDGTFSGTAIAVTVPFGSNKASLVPTIVHTGSSVSPDSSVVADFTNPVTFKVTADDGTTKSYMVTVTVAKNSVKDITKFTILGVNGTISGTDIGFTLPYGTDKTNLTPTIEHSGVSVLPASGLAQNFTSSVTYTVTADDGSTKDYSVSVTVAKKSAKDITKFTILSVDGAFSGTAISLTLPYGTDKTGLTPTIEHTGSSVSPASGSAENFTSPVTYTVTADDGSTKDYTVTVNVAKNSAKDITKFTILGIYGTISGTNIALTVPFGIDKTSLTSSVTHSGASISPSSGTSQNFTNPVTYTVTADDGSIKDYIVTVTVAKSWTKDILKFTILGVDATISGTNIFITLPYGTDKASLIPSVTHTGASVSPASGTLQSFTNPVTYTVTADDGSTFSYSVSVSIAAVSTVNTLSSLVLSPGMLSLAFASGMTSYTATVVNFVTSITVTPTATSPYAAVTVNGASVASGNGLSVSLVEGKNAIAVIITSQSGSTKTYTFNVIRYLTAIVSSTSGSGINAKTSYMLLDGTAFNTIQATADSITNITFPMGKADDSTGTITSPFVMAETNVTYELWTTVRTWALSNGYTFANTGQNGSDSSGNALSTAISTQYPVTCVNWRDAIVWCNAFTEYYNSNNGTGTDLAVVYCSDSGYGTPIRTSTNSTTITYTSNGSQDAPYVNTSAKGFRLPTSVEYEFAARYIGTTTSNANVVNKNGVYYTNGSSASGATAIYSDTTATGLVGVFGVSSTSIVKSKTFGANALGLYDMSGNVDNWNFDWYPYATGQLRVLRGGSYYYGADSLQVGIVGGSMPYDVWSRYGFRFSRNK